MRAMIGGWLALVLLAAPGPVSGQRQELLVSAAASLADVMQQIARAYEARTGTRVLVNAAASNTLARQIAAGAPVDVFISADEAQMDLVRNEIAAGTRFDVLANQLAIAVAADRPPGLRSARDLTGASFARVAIGDPAAVPAGVYAKAYLEKIGIWKALEKKLIPSASVRLALAAVEHGAADAAIVYRTDVAAAHRARLALVIPATEGPAIVYPVAVMQRAGHAAEARMFVSWLRGAEASAIFQAAGFTPLAQPTR